MELLDALDQSWGAARAIAHGLPADDPAWGKPTPCPGWSVQDVVAHLGHIEGMFRGFPQPDPPADHVPPANPLDGLTEAGVAARRAWDVATVLDELDRAAAAALAHFGSLDDAGWAQDTIGPVGPTTMRGLAGLRVFDVTIHVLDLRHALGQPLDPAATPAALQVAVDGIVDRAPWGAVKKAGLADGTRVRLDLTGPGARTVDIAVADGRGALLPPEGTPTATLRGTGAALLVAVAGREAMIDAAGGLQPDGPAAAQLAERYRYFQ